MLKEVWTEERLEEVRRLYEASFPESEKKPFSFMLQKRQEGFFDILAIENGQGEFCGLAIMLLSGDLALLDYLAIAPKHQGSGLGGETLGELRKRYGAEKIVVEIERTAGAAGSSAQEGLLPAKRHEAHGAAGGADGRGNGSAHIRQRAVVSGIFSYVP